MVCKLVEVLVDDPNHLLQLLQVVVEGLVDWKDIQFEEHPFEGIQMEGHPFEGTLEEDPFEDVQIGRDPFEDILEEFQGTQIAEEDPFD